MQPRLQLINVVLLQLKSFVSFSCSGKSSTLVGVLNFDVFPQFLSTLTTFYEIKDMHYFIKTNRKGW